MVATLPDSGGTVHAGELEIRLGEGLVLASGRALTLSVREFELLAAMARRVGAIITRDELYASVWNGELRPGDRSVDVYVSKLRSKLEGVLPDRRFIHTHQGFGYRFQPEAARRPAGAPLGAAAIGDLTGAGAADAAAAGADGSPARNGIAPSGVATFSHDVHIGVADG